VDCSRELKEPPLQLKEGAARWQRQVVEEEERLRGSVFRRGAVDAVELLRNLAKRVHWDLDVVQEDGIAAGSQDEKGYCQTATAGCGGQSTKSLAVSGHPFLRHWKSEGDNACQRVDRQQGVLDNGSHTDELTVRAGANTP
jgi:hypothetical protein